ncbi:hypothetical protein BBM02_00195 [Vibrio parahaemolyticus]|uniref:hypothetical protein n=1 Tax=Vibrio parahaemolyticus TaxID=670 RepID=UPI00084AC07D|nr:hypothetical protein [Vibrio parahaemolyticus]PWF65793.1 hypothetical protein CCD93_22330 [Vibrio sp. T21]EGQ9806799.1 hypothetical protein [Vibrio parahaemolyticus]EIY7833761.1 hypothetical protein [Vibrio parahaemolyticus]EJC7121972.1 hypothetical protein [Vibrio parahaemolyticus]EJG1696116.1 hypothetical protein [Vibrio parahaemolyticus]
MFKNKHFILALLIAPILSIIAYFGTDMALSEKPHAAKEGETYKLASKSNCRYTSGLCDMENGDFKVKFRSEKLTKDSLELSLNAAYPLEGVKLSVVDDQQQNAQPIDMTRADQAGQNWYISLPKPTSADSWLRVVIQAEGTLYYGETQTAFVKYETLFTE